MMKGLKRHKHTNLQTQGHKAYNKLNKSTLTQAYIGQHIKHNHLCTRTCDSGCSFPHVLRVPNTQPYTDELCLKS